MRLPRRWTQHAREVEPLVGLGLLDHGLERAYELGARDVTHLVDRGVGALRIGVAKMDGREHRGAGLQRANRLEALFARDLRASCTTRRAHRGSLLHELERARDGLVAGLGARLEQMTRDRRGLERACGLHDPAASGVLGPRVDRVEVRLDLRLVLGRRDAHEHLVHGACATFVALLRELLGRRVQRLVALRAEHLVLQLAGVDEVHRALERRHRAFAVLRLEARRDANHLATDDALQAQLALAAVRLAREEIAHGSGERIVAHLRARDGGALRVVRGAAIASAARTAGRHR